MARGKYEMAIRHTVPDRLVMEVTGLMPEEAEPLAMLAVAYARKNAPKLSGAGASRMEGVFGYGFFGVHWLDDHIWYNEHGTQPFTMKALAGKTIPMWIDDPTGTEHIKYPRAPRRTTLSGKAQVLIFRRAALPGQRKLVKRVRHGVVATVDVPMSYPGAPGRIGVREAALPHTAEGRVGGRIAGGNIGVRWRNPGISPRRFIEHALRMAARDGGVVGNIVPLRVG